MERAREITRAALTQFEQVPPFLFYSDAQGSYYDVLEEELDSEQSKDGFISVMRMAAMVAELRQSVLVLESWASTDTSIMPSQDPNRFTVIVIIGEDAAEQIVEVYRVADDRSMMEPFMPDETIGTISSRFTFFQGNLLKQNSPF
jgi:hypothetical protein